ncbi:divalent-cation tolerance protein CutA [Methanospirillum lacunae]|uniref:Divalent-cation tolerance protein CutA n=1 Tax=Methanospirillum lacunae TaxID=668570 RepID=A0A2V2N769_9EURY|nr:divalent-cation tolerance protein CutA [Methanospirillum lacunae]PWR72338.1 divalent-cation tolerance protein CutA [Methanospirillum lacunae]
MADENLSDISVIYCTAPSDDSTRIARELLERRLVACVNITPVRSLYRWEGHLCDEKEDLLIIKTANHCVEDLIVAIRTIHPYEVPEIIALPVSKGFSGYIDWVMNETV